MNAPFAGGGRPGLFASPSFYADYYRRAMNPYAAVPAIPTAAQPGAAAGRGWHGGRFLPFGPPAAPQPTQPAPSPDALLHALQQLMPGLASGGLFLLGGGPPVSE